MIEESVVGAWIFLIAVSLKMRVAVVALRSKRFAGISLVTRERTIDNKYAISLHKSCARYRHSFTIII
ncbi:MAG: hypothetical protein ACKO38_15600, partial [Planctomycetota bacterium]